MIYSLIRIIGDRHAGFILCLIVVFNLIVGSLVMNSHPELYPSFFHLNLNYFFQPVRGVHFWLYALLLTFTLFGINLLACIIDSIIRLLNNKAGRLKASAALLFHVALVTTMAAHLHEGFYASTQRIPITAQGVALPELGRVQVESLKNIYYPDNSLKDTEVTLLFNQPDGQRISKDIAFNQPAIFDGGRRQVVMLSGQMTPSGVVITRGMDNREFRLEPNKPQPLGSGNLLLQGLFETETGLPYAQFLWQPDGHGKDAAPDDKNRHTRLPHPNPDGTTSHSTKPASGQVAGYLPGGEGANESLRELHINDGNQQQHMMALHTDAPHSQIKIDGVLYQFKNNIETPFIVAIVRYNPAIPLMLVSLLLASVATLLLINWLRTRSKEQFQKSF